MKFTAKNFQIHSELELDLKPFTVITGPSGSGKSALIRALRVLFYNIPAGGFVKKGEKELYISLDDGQILTEYSRNPTVSYTINGKEYNAIGRNSLSILEEAGYSSIEVDKKKYYPQIASQFDSPFLISFSDAEVSKLLSQLSQSGRLKVAKESIKKSGNGLSDMLKVRLSDRVTVQSKLTEVNEVLAVLPRFDSITASRIALEELKNKLARLDALASKISENKRYLTNVPKTPTNPEGYIVAVKAVNIPKAVVPLNVPNISAISHLSNQYFTILQINGAQAKIRSFDQEKGFQKKIGPKNFGGQVENLEKCISLFTKIIGLSTMRNTLPLSTVELQSEAEEIKNTIGVCGECGQFLNESLPTPQSHDSNHRKIHGA